MLESIVTYGKFVKLLRMYDTSIHLYIYIYLLHRNSSSLNWNNLLIWLLLVASYLHVEETFILCILYWISAKQRLRCGYTAAIFCLYKVSCVDWIGNFINSELSKFGYCLVNFIEFKIPNYTVSGYIYARWDNYLNWLTWTYCILTKLLFWVFIC